MKSNYKRIRKIRRLAVAGCFAALAIPTTASAMLPNDVGVRHENAQQSQPYTLPSDFRSEVQTQASQQQPYTLPTAFHSEVQTQAPQSPTTPKFVLARNFTPEVGTASSPLSSSPAVVSEIQSVTDNDGRTLAIVLAAIALAIALGTLAYATIRMTQMQRRELSSH